jgi:hypothetical protein
MLFKQKPKKEIIVSKFLEDLPGLKDVTVDPRSYAPDRLKDACNNLKFNSSMEVDPIENLTIQFIFRSFFYIMHQTGLYNPQKKLFNHIASVNRVEIKEYKKLSKQQKESSKVSDIYFYDIHGKFMILRLEHPSSNLDAAPLPKLFNEANNQKCVGVIYVSNQEPAQDLIEMIRKRTNYKNELERFNSPLNDHASFNFISYQASPSAVVYKLVHPDLVKAESAKASVAAELISALYDNSATLVG